MRKISSKLAALAWAALALAAPLAWAVCGAGCSSGAEEAVEVSSLDRPVAIAVATIDWEPTPAEAELKEQFAGLWESCLGETKRPYAFVANSAGDSVARIDLCTGEIKNTAVKGNPFVVSHIPVGRLPSDVATSLDSGQTRIFVANSGETSLSIIETRQARTLPDRAPLDASPSRLAVSPSPTVPEGDVWATLPANGQLVRVVKVQGGENERWAPNLTVDLDDTALPKKPLPSGLVVHPNGAALYISDMANPVFHVVDLAHPELPPSTRDVHRPQRSLAISPDGRWLYLAVLDERRVAVYDLAQDRYVDTNEELPTHRNGPPPSDEFDYDIELMSVPRAVIFASIQKEVQFIDGDEDGDLDADAETGIEESEEETVEADGDGEDGDAAENETDAAARLMQEDGDQETAEDADAGEAEEADDETIQLDRALYAYSIGYNGTVQVIDAHRDVHELFDTNPDSPSYLEILPRNELEVDIGLCLTDIDYRVYNGRTPDAVWEFHYNGVVPETDLSVSGRFDFASDRLYDDNANFARLTTIMPRPNESNPDDPQAFKGDYLVIKTSPLTPGEDRPGCYEEAVGEDGVTRVQPLDQVRLEIIDVTPDYIAFDRKGVSLEDCFNTYVEYFVRANENYLVFMTEIDQDGRRIKPRAYMGRGRNVEFIPGDRVTGREQFESLRFERSDWANFVCTIETPVEGGDPVREYRFRDDLGIAGTDEVVKGMRCKNPWEDDNRSIVSFSNDLISFSICQDPTNLDVQAKQDSTFLYAFRTFSGTNEIRRITLTLANPDSPVGTLLEDAAVLDVFPEFPRLYLVDSSEEIVYVVDLTTDEVITLIF